MPRAVFANFAVDLPAGWGDITAEVEADDPPATVARDDGVGALQFSISLYEAGPRPRGDVKELQALLDEFAESHGLILPSNPTSEQSPRGLVAASFKWDDDFVRVWYLAGEGNVALVTFTCAAGEVSRPELAEAEQIVRSVIFGDAAAG